MIIAPTINYCSYKFNNIVKTYPKTVAFISGAISGLAFAPSFLFIGLFFTIPLLLELIYQSNSQKSAFLYGWIFGFAHFLCSLYWIAVGITVYIDEFWWAIPFALVGLPIILAIFPAFSCLVSWYGRHYKPQIWIFIFSNVWVFFEWLRSFVFSGFPWNLLGYTLCFSDTLIQPASAFGIFGLSFIVLFAACNLWSIRVRIVWMWHFLTTCLIMTSLVTWGTYMLNSNSTEYTEIYARLVQPSIAMENKWSFKSLYKNIEAHVRLSNAPSERTPDLVIWSEAAVTIPYGQFNYLDNILFEATEKNKILVTGGILEDEDDKIFSSIYALNNEGKLLFKYHKSHLIPFAEYMPFKAILPIKKFTHGIIDYSPGDKNQLISLEVKGRKLLVRPIVCYESIFPDEIKNNEAQLFINVTNDSWYGRTSGPYQHLHISRLRSVENGIPMLRVANNGITAVIDGYGRVIKQTNLNDVTFIDSYIPKSHSTLYSLYGNLFLFIFMVFTIAISKCINNICKFLLIRVDVKQF